LGDLSFQTLPRNGYYRRYAVMIGRRQVGIVSKVSEHQQWMFERDGQRWFARRRQDVVSAGIAALTHPATDEASGRRERDR
jgi:hypothetical protein